MSGSTEPVTLTLTDSSDGANEAGTYNLTFWDRKYLAKPDPSKPPTPDPLIIWGEMDQPAGNSANGNVDLTFDYWPVIADGLIAAGEASEIGDVAEGLGIIELDPQFTAVAAAVGTVCSVSGEISEQQVVKHSVNVVQTFTSGIPESEGGEGLPGCEYDPQPVLGPGETLVQLQKYATKYHMAEGGYYQSMVDETFSYDTYGTDGYDGPGSQTVRLLPSGGQAYYIGKFVFN
jgi:hypothetical protein